LEFLHILREKSSCEEKDFASRERGTIEGFLVRKWSLKKCRSSNDAGEIEHDGGRYWRGCTKGRGGGG
jgi:hypothetical protein